MLAGAADKALLDANAARDLNPRWSKAYFRQGIALHAMALFPNAIAAFASGKTARRTRPSLSPLATEKDCVLRINCEGAANVNKAVYTAISVACGWVGAVMSASLKTAKDAIEN